MLENGLIIIIMGSIAILYFVRMLVYISQFLLIVWKDVVEMASIIKSDITGIEVERELR
ncbi:MAG: hypothetical protein CM1200mP12_02790 [Gammaproteobacteria bacterium]|jgi:hypothetical protein|nr:MAG: hypothetical protein CM1200mP12_02790 [Gammaproteobacteria bacterium]|tara:strand:- start:66 stop:242 length:177 start_codon:yes stop_codon:yes gene_type:complete